MKNLLLVDAKFDRQPVYVFFSHFITSARSEIVFIRWPYFRVTLTKKCLRRKVPIKIRLIKLSDEMQGKHSNKSFYRNINTFTLTFPTEGYSMVASLPQFHPTAFLICPVTSINIHIQFL